MGIAHWFSLWVLLLLLLRLLLLLLLLLLRVLLLLRRLLAPRCGCTALLRSATRARQGRGADLADNLENLDRNINSIRDHLI